MWLLPYPLFRARQNKFNELIATGITVSAGVSAIVVIITSVVTAIMIVITSIITSIMVITMPRRRYNNDATRRHNYYGWSMIIMSIMRSSVIITTAAITNGNRFTVIRFMAAR
jgi:hypothetical protein